MVIGYSRSTAIANHADHFVAAPDGKCVSLVVAPIECEAVAYGLYNARFFVLGCNDLVIAVDHKPLLKVLGNRSLDISSTRHRNLKEKTLRYRFTVLHVPGTKHKAADAVLRKPTGLTDPLMMHLPDDDVGDRDCCDTLLTVVRTSAPTEPLSPCAVEIEVACMALSNLESVTWSKEATASDETFLELLSLIEDGFALSSNISNSLKAFLRHKEFLPGDTVQSKNCYTLCPLYTNPSLPASSVSKCDVNDFTS